MAGARVHAKIPFPARFPANFPTIIAREAAGMLTLQGVCKTFGTARALAPTDLHVARGSTTVLIGPSGCGKSTLLRLVAGLIWPDAGSVAIDGTPLQPDNLLAVRQRLGYVIQDGGLFPHLNARRNVALMAGYLGSEQARIDARVAELAELTRFPADALRRYPAQLSGGQRQRVALMRALMLDPDLLLLDEPLGALDPITRSDLQHDLKEIFQRLHKTVLLVTHDLGEAAFFGDMLVLMRDGVIVQRGTFDELLRAPADPFVPRFINAQRSPVAALAGPAEDTHVQPPR
jgi:osmoprotectant transport system ATP-binding protein